MSAYPRTQAEFREWFSTEAACAKYLARVRWPEGFRCPRCGHDEAWHMSRGLYRCKACDTQTSVTAGTIFQGTRKPLRLWLEAMWHVTQRPAGVSALRIQKVLGLGSYHTAWTWMHKLRRAMVRPDRDRVTGTAQVDQGHLDGFKPRQMGLVPWGRPLVFAAVEDIGGLPGRLRLARVPDRTAGSLQGAIRRAVEVGAMIHTDDWPAYRGLRLYGYRHRIIQSSVLQPQFGLLPLVDRVIDQLARWLLETPHGAARPSHLDYYLDEFAFRFNHRRLRSHGKVFHQLVRQAVEVDPVPAQSLRGYRKV